MTAMIGSADCPPARVAATRDGLHRVAEHLLAAARYAASGEIGLVPAPGDPAFWNAPFGAARTFRQIGTVAEAAAFFRDGRARALAAAAATPVRRTS